MVYRFLASFVVIFSIALNTHASNLDNMIKDLIIEKLGAQVTDIELKFDSNTKLREAEAYKDQIKNVQLLYFAPNYSTFRVSVTSDNDATLELAGRYTAYIEVPVTVRAIVHGGVITDSDVSTTRTPLAKMKGGYIESIDQVVGMQARRNLGNGVLIRNSDIVKPTLIRQNDSVSIIYNQSNIKLRTMGVALQSGALGDNIKVKNESTGIIVHGSVKGKNLVQVGEE